MAQFWGGGASGVFVGARFVITVDVACEMLVVVDVVGVLRVPGGLPAVLVVVALEVPVLGEEQLTNKSEINRAQLAEKRDTRLTIREEECWKIICCSFFL
jgi:hypothetical protein